MNTNFGPTTQAQKFGFVDIATAVLALCVLFQNHLPSVHLKSQLAGNDPPVVDAGTGRTIEFPNTLRLDSTVTDDGLPTGAVVTLTWSKQSGAGIVTFADTHSGDTLVSFSQTGTYVLHLLADDTEDTGSDTVTIVVNPAHVSDPDLKHWYKMDEGSGSTVLADSGTGTQFNLTMVNGAARVPGKQGNAVEFNGIDQYADSGVNTDYVLTEPFTMMAWVKTTSTSTGVVLSVTNSGSATEQWGIGVAANGSAMFFSNRTQRTFSPVTVNDGQWHHIMAVVTGGGKIDLFVDSANGVIGAYTGLPPTSNRITLGALEADGGVVQEYFDGTIDDARFYSKGFSGAEELEQFVKIPTVVSLISSPHPANHGSGVTLRAFVSPATATGTITFSSGAYTIATVDLARGSGAYTSSAFAAGTYQFVATYAANYRHLGSESIPVTQQINKVNTHLSLVSTPNPSSTGALVTFTATIFAPTATGTIVFSESGVTLHTATLGHGSGSYATSSLSTGSHLILASYDGNHHFAGSTATRLHSVRSPSTTSIVTSLNPSGLGTSVTFTASVSPSTATGTITFFASGASVGSVTLGHGSGSLAKSFSLGTHPIYASYGGNTLFSTGSSSLLYQKVIPTTTTSLVSSENPSTSGTLLRFTASVTPSTATGYLLFADSGSALSTIPVGHGSGVYATSTLTVGTHAIVATYSGSSNHARSISNTISQVITLNVPPAMDAGSGATIELSQTANLDGIASDDGLPSSGTFTITWSKQSGPGIVTFGSIHSADTTASFSQTGTYVLLLTGDDTQFVRTDTVTIVVTEDAIDDGSLLHYYKLNDGAGTIADDFVTANALDLTLFNSPSWVTGKFGGALLLNGTTQYGDVRGAPTFALETPYTMTAWVKTASTATGVVLAVTNSGSTTDQFGIGVRQGHAYAFGVRSNRITAGGSVNDDEWHLIAASTATGGELELSVDGVLVGTGTISAVPALVDRITLGALRSSGGTLIHPYAGRIDDARLYHRALSLSEIQQLTKIPTTTAISTTPNPSEYGSGITLTATLTPSTATGMVLFYESGSFLAVRTLTGGIATYTSTGFTIGTHWFSASYSGNQLYAPSTSIYVSHVVGKITTTATVSTSPNPSQYGQQITMSGFVVPATATGTITFTNNGQTFSPAIAIGHGSASYVTSLLSVGSHTVTVIYSGNATHLNVTSNPITHVVTALPSSSSSSSSVQLGQDINNALNGGGGGRGNKSGYLSGRVRGNGSMNTTLYGGKVKISMSNLLLHQSAPPPEEAFMDVDASQWFAEYVIDLVSRKIVSGYKDERGISLGLFQPGNNVTIAEMLKIALKAAGVQIIYYKEALNPGDLVDWAYPFVVKGKEMNLSIFQDPNVQIHEPATRVEVITMMLEAFGIGIEEAPDAEFSDMPLDAHDAAVINTAAALGIIEGDTDEDGKALNTVRPYEYINRAETAKIVSKMIEVTGK